MLREIISLTLVSITAVFVVVDPVGAVPFFLALTRDLEPSRRREVARRAAFAAFLFLAIFAVAGAVIFRWLGVSLGAFKMAGGVLLLIMAVDMIRTQPSPVRVTAGEIEAGAAREDVAVVPLAMPLLAGPGSIVTVVVLASRARATHSWRVLPVLLAILLVSVACYYILALGAKTEKLLGRTGMNVAERLAGLLLAALAIQFLIDGLMEAFPGLGV
jgi:multiple antibiotic resistance protein